MWLRGSMFTRYVTFIFLVGLSALFFTSGRSASLGGVTREGSLSTVTGAERAGLPDAVRPMPAP